MKKLTNQQIFMNNILDQNSTFEQKQSFISIAHNLILTMPNKENDLSKVIVVADCGKENSSSYTAYNIAYCISEFGKKALVIDGNDLQPSLHWIVNYSNEEGLSTKNVVRNHIKINKGLTILPYGSNGISPFDKEDGISKIINFYNDKFDYIFINCPSIKASSNTIACKNVCDGVLLSIKEFATTLENINIAKDKLAFAGMKIIGCNYIH